MASLLTQRYKSARISQWWRLQESASQYLWLVQIETQTNAPKNLQGIKLERRLFATWRDGNCCKFQQLWIYHYSQYYAHFMRIFHPALVEDPIKLSPGLLYLKEGKSFYVWHGPRKRNIIMQWQSNLKKLWWISMTFTPKTSTSISCKKQEEGKRNG